MKRNNILEIILYLYFFFLARRRKAILCLQIIKPLLGRLDYALKRDDIVFLGDKTDFKTRDISPTATRI